MSNQKHFCIYHGNCADGFGAAWVVRKWYAKQGWTSKNGVDLQFVPAFYGKPAINLPKGAIVTMVDFSFKKPVLQKLAEQVGEEGSILILDHHKTAADDLKEYVGDVSKGVINAIFDMNRSGAGITWDHYFPNEPRPRLLDVIEDRDLWRFKLGQDFTREVQACLFSFEYDFDIWTDLMKLDVQQMRRDGAVIERKHFKDIRELIATNMFYMDIGGFNVPVLNVPYMWSSDAGHIMWKETGSAFAACYWDNTEGRVFSLRSSKDFDVSAVAKSYGGGGHPQAAGFNVPLTHPLANRM